MKLTDFLCAGRIWHKLKSDWKFLGWAWLKKGEASQMTLTLTVSEEWTDVINWFFAGWYRFTKIKSWSKFYIYRHGQKWVWPVWSWDSRIDYISKMKRWNKLIFCILHWYKFRIATGCTLRMNLWITLIFWMLIVMQYYLVILISYSLTFKCWGSFAVVLLVSIFLSVFV